LNSSNSTEAVFVDIHTRYPVNHFHFNKSDTLIDPWHLFVQENDRLILISHSVID